MSSKFTGHVANADTPLMPLKCSMNARMPLADRLKPVQQQDSVRRDRTSSTPEPIRSYFLQKRHHGETTYTNGASTYVRSAADVPPRQKEQKSATPNDLEPPKFDAETTTQQNSHGIATNHPKDFFSKARKMERKDDDVRRDVYIPPTRAGASHMQRTVEIMRNREKMEELQPPSQAYGKVQRPKACIPQLAKSEDVRFTHISPLTTNQMDFQTPSGKLNAVTDGTSPNGQRRAISQMSSSKELFVGTAKDREDLLPGFMGHVPGHLINSGKVNGPNDTLRLYSKCPHNVAVSKNAVHLPPAGAAGAGNSPSPNRIPRGALTVNAFYEEEAAKSVDERGMNKVISGRSTAVRKFFSAGAGDADNTVADQFCTKFRPGGGTMKQGPSSTWGWINDAELKRNTMQYD